MANIQRIVKVCDICGEETNGYKYWRTETDNMGVIGEYYFTIEVCEECVNAVKYHIKKDMLVERYDDIKIDLERDKKTIELFKSIVMNQCD